MKNQADSQLMTVSTAMSRQSIKAMWLVALVFYPAVAAVGWLIWTYWL